MSETTIVNADLIHWLQENRWLMQNDYLPKYHAIVSDPPYFLGSIVKRFGGKNAAPAQFGKDGAFQRQSAGFMGMSWDGFDDVWQYQAWVQSWGEMLLDFVYPGALLAMWGSPRTYHRLAAGLEDAGWEIFDSLMFLHGQGFPKSADIGKLTAKNGDHDEVWDGFKTQLKPAFEPIVIARAPRGKFGYADLARSFGSGALNIDAARIPYSGEIDPRTFEGEWATDKVGYEGGFEGNEQGVSELGRYPSNVILGCACESDEHQPDCPVAHLNSLGDRKAGGNLSGQEPSAKTSGIYNGGFQRNNQFESYDDSGSAARFFYTAKAARWERDAGLNDLDSQQVGDGRKTPIDNAYQRGATPRLNPHPTLKAIQLTTWLAKLFLPPVLGQQRRLLIPFSGAGSECIGAALAGWDEITGIERETQYAEVARKRIAWWSGFTSYDAAKAEYDRLHPTTPTVAEKQEAAGQIALF